MNHHRYMQEPGGACLGTESFGMTDVLLAGISPQGGSSVATNQAGAAARREGGRARWTPGTHHTESPKQALRRPVTRRVGVKVAAVGYPSFLPPPRVWPRPPLACHGGIIRATWAWHLDTYQATARPGIKATHLRKLMATADTTTADTLIAVMGKIIGLICIVGKLLKSP